jgi:hypothetical protein
MWDSNFFKKRKYIAWRAKPIGDAIISQFCPRSIIDIGCSIGEFIKYFVDHNIDADGTEITREVEPYLMFARDRLIIQDICASMPPPPRKYDLAMCFMVIGRLPEAYWNIAAYNLTQYSDTIVTVVEKEHRWRVSMNLHNYHENFEATAKFRYLIKTWKDKTAIRSFYNYSQVFERIK